MAKIELNRLKKSFGQIVAVKQLDLVIEDGKLSAKFDIQGYIITMKGSFEGDTYTGTTNFDGNEFPMNATRKPAEE